jgi:DNA-binding NarL/FixJ family response regulator
VLVVDDHAIVRAGVRALLADTRDWEVCGEAGNGSEAVDKVQQLSPDVVLLDVTMPCMNGFEAAALIREKAPRTKVVFLTMHHVPTTGRLVGAHGFISKSSAAQDLVAVLNKVFRPGSPAGAP